jgi:hypothetical protein
MGSKKEEEEIKHFYFNSEFPLTVSLVNLLITKVCIQPLKCLSSRELSIQIVSFCSKGGGKESFSHLEVKQCAMSKIGYNKEKLLFLRISYNSSSLAVFSLVFHILFARKQVHCVVQKYP